MINLCIFDLDGLLVDSETGMWFNNEKKVLKSLGLSASDEFLRSIVGTGASTNKPMFKKLFGEDFDYEDYSQRVYKENEKSILNKEVPVRKGAFELLDYLVSKNIPISLGSSSERKYVEDMLKSCELDKYFSSVVSGSDVEYAKPAPDIYQKCLSYYDVPSSQAVIFEDAHSGLQAGMAANTRVILVPDSGILVDSDFVDAYKVIEDLSKAIEIIEEENERTISV